MAHDIIVIGASAGGVEALLRLVADLPETLPAAVLLVLHRPPDQQSLLPHLLRRTGRLPADDAEDGQTIMPGHIYIAPPDRHMLVENGALRLVRGPKENHSRPAIDPLFRSAAQAFGSRVVGVILSGTLFDGTAGLFAVKRRGGVAIVQDPEEAAFPAMPESAIANVAVDSVLPIDEIARLLVKLVGKPVEQKELTAMSSTPSEFNELLEIVIENRMEQIEGRRHGQTTVYTCPDCGGTLWQADAGSLVQFRCHVGHVYTAEGMVQEQTEALERSLWFSIRTFTDKSVLLRQLAAHEAQAGDSSAAARLLREAEAAERHANLLRGVVQADTPDIPPAIAPQQPIREEE